MIYEPENLKNKRAIYEKEDKLAYPISLSILGGTTIYLCEHSNSLCKSTIGF